jgi:hypothetical protein
MSALPAEPTPRLAPRRLPNLFGRLTSILSDHQQLGRTLRGLVDLCNALDSGVERVPEKLNPGRMLGNLHAHLSRHFVAEEADGHFGLMAREQPELLPRVVALKADHAAFLEEIARMLGLAADIALWSELSEATRRLIARLEAHEQAEAELVERFLLTAERPR